MYLYKLSDKNNQVLYVGKTKSLKQRFFQHKRDKDWWAEVDKIEFTEINKFLVDTYEVFYINYYRTLYNKKDINATYIKFNLKHLEWERY